MNFFDTVLIQPIFNLLSLLYSLFGDFGLALIAFGVITRLAMWPLIKKQLHQAKIMRKLQPELKKIKKSTKGNKQLESMQMLELYKKHGVSPFRSIGILLLQLPIFIAIYQVVRIFSDGQDRIASFSYDFLEGLSGIKEMVADPTNFNESLLGLVDLTQKAWESGNINFLLILIAAVAAVLQYYMSKQTLPQADGTKTFKSLMAEAAEGKQPDQSEMNALVMGKMVKFLPIFMFLVMINLPAALSLYYVASNLIAIFQQRNILHQDEEEMIEIADEKSPQKTKPEAKMVKKNITKIVASEGKKGKKR